MKDSKVDLVAGARVEATSMNADISSLVHQQSNLVILEGSNEVSQGIFGSMFMSQGDGKVEFSDISPRFNLSDSLWHTSSTNNSLIVRGSTRTGGVAGFDRLILNPTMENASMDHSMLIVDGYSNGDRVDPIFSPVADFAGKKN